MTPFLWIEQEHVTDADIGRAVRYIPMHADGDLGHPDIEDGVITSFNHKYVFVRYGRNQTGTATDPRDLRWGGPLGATERWYYVEVVRHTENDGARAVRRGLEPHEKRYKLHELKAEIERGRRDSQLPRDLLKERAEIDEILALLGVNPDEHRNAK